MPDLPEPNTSYAKIDPRTQFQAITSCGFQDRIDLMARMQNQISTRSRRVQEIRETQKVGLIEAEQIARRERLKDLIDQADSIEDLKIVLREIVDA